MWNPNEDSKNVAFIEVKGPNDILSPKQILWLNYLQSLGIEVKIGYRLRRVTFTIMNLKILSLHQLILIKF